MTLRKEVDAQPHADQVVEDLAEDEKPREVNGQRPENHGTVDETDGDENHGHHDGSESVRHNLLHHIYVLGEGREEAAGRVVGQEERSDGAEAGGEGPAEPVADSDCHGDQNTG